MDMVVGHGDDVEVTSIDKHHFGRFAERNLI